MEAVGLDTVRAVDDSAEAALTFQGFDFNDAHEGKLARYARYVVHHDR